MQLTTQSCCPFGLYCLWPRMFSIDMWFYNPAEAESLLPNTGFSDHGWGRTLSQPLEEMEEIEPFHESRGEGRLSLHKTR